MTLPHFTPILDDLASEFGLVDAAVISAIWRFCQMSKKFCNASNATIGEMIGLNRTTVSKAIKRLVDGKHVTDHSPHRLKSPHDLTLSVDLINRFNPKRDDNNVKSVDLITSSVDLINRNVKSVDLITQRDSSKTLLKDTTTTASPKNQIDATPPPDPHLTPTPQQPTTASSPPDTGGSGGGVDENLARISTIYEQEIGFISPVASDTIKDWIATYPHQWIIEAIAIAVAANKRQARYVNGVLRRWKNDGRGNTMPGKNGKPSGLAPDQQEVYQRLEDEWKRQKKNSDVYSVTPATV